VKSAIINSVNKIGYIYLPEFYADFERPGGARCAADVAKEIEKLKAEKIDGIVLDLRGNGGGSLYDVVQMAGLFIKNGPICQVKGRDKDATILEDKDEKIQYDGPLVVMVDGTSASASEIFAAAIQDYKRGIVIGSSSTYGKGTVQRMISLNPDNQYELAPKTSDQDDLGNVKLTIQKFYRINGGATQIRGVVPDIILPDRFDYLKFRERDNKSALQWDEISRAKYKVWSVIPSEELINSSNDEINKSPNFSGIKSNAGWLQKYFEKDYSLNITKYKDEQTQLKSITKQMENLTKLKDTIRFSNLTADIESINSSQEKIDKNKQWIKFRNTDIYIDESIKVMNRLIANYNTAKLN
jgi:carboxyl-terminal processing protease